MKKSFLFATVVSSMLLFSCGGSEDKKQNDGVVPDTTHGVSAMANDSLQGELAYICPCGGCPEIRESKPGNCSKCEMELVAEKK